MFTTRRVVGGTEGRHVCMAANIGTGQQSSSRLQIVAGVILGAIFIPMKVIRPDDESGDPRAAIPVGDQ